MELRVVIQDKEGPPVLGDIPLPIDDRSENPAITICLIEGGMSSGEPSVLIISSSDAQGSVVLQTSFDKFLMAASAMMTAAKGHFNWTRPEGFASLDPTMSPELRKKLLESIKKELEEWPDGD